MDPIDWKKLTDLSGGGPIEVERVRLVDQGITVEGRFTPPALAALAADDQIFIAAFVRCHGSIKQMEKFFGVSYPTIKNRLNKLAAQLPFVEVEPAETSTRPNPSDLIAQLERGERTVREVLSELDARTDATKE